MRIAATPEQSRTILGAMLAVASAGSQPTAADRAAIAAAARAIFRIDLGPQLTGLTPPNAQALSALKSNAALANEAVSFATVMAFVDGTLDQAKLKAVLGLAAQLGVHEDYVDDIADLAQGQLRNATAHMIRANLESVTGRPWDIKDMEPWLLPYKAKPDRDLAARFHALATLPQNTFGFTFYDFYSRNKYAFPGEPDALNVAFAVPHDSTHVLGGYDTTPRGELLTSTLTAAMHRSEAMSGHVLPVILSWHLGIPLNEVAGAAKGALDPEAFWEAWARGEATSIDLFGPKWDFWQEAPQPIAAVRAKVGLA